MVATVADAPDQKTVTKVALKSVYKAKSPSKSSRDPDLVDHNACVSTVWPGMAQKSADPRSVWDALNLQP